ncbi:hypothetical protein JX266_011450 [Neoarthrinium moseri]|nr:hypothetical protein JX266_011450 [Neoarthrinium moseri]
MSIDQILVAPGGENITPPPKSDIVATGLGEVGDQYTLEPSALERTLRGVAVAIQLEKEWDGMLAQWFSITQKKSSTALSVTQWLAAAQEELSSEPELVLIMNVVIGLSYMRERGRTSDLRQDPLSVDFIWPIIRAALAAPNSSFKVSRSAGGFLFVPLCSLIKDGKIDELWRLHVWLPDGKRGNVIHSHNAFGQSWILAGEGKNLLWSVKPAEYDQATHAEYGLQWNDGKKSDSAYKTHQVSSTIVNTKKYVVADLSSTDVHRRNTTYSVSDKQWHSSEVAPDRVCATLFVFDALRGFRDIAPVLGPKDGESSTQIRDPAGHTVKEIVKTVGNVRAWEDLVQSGRRYNLSGKRDVAEETFKRALKLCQELPGFPNRELYIKSTRNEME